LQCSDADLRELLDYVDEDGDRVINIYEWTTRLVDVLNYEFDFTEENDTVSQQSPDIAKIDQLSNPERIDFWYQTFSSQELVLSLLK